MKRVRLPVMFIASLATSAIVFSFSSSHAKDLMISGATCVGTANGYDCGLSTGTDFSPLTIGVAKVEVSWSSIDPSRQPYAFACRTSYYYGTVKVLGTRIQNAD